jgi:hypothetical protein
MKYFALPFCLLMLLLSACEREDRFGSGLPVIFQIDQLLLRGGDTITITGNNFSENAANNRVTFNGIQALIVSSSFRDLVVVVPERAGAGRLVVSTRAGRSNEFPYRYTYQVMGVNTLNLNVEFTTFRKMKIINNQIFLISNFESSPSLPSTPSFTKIYRFRLDGSAVQEGLTPLIINNFNVGAIAGDAQGNFVVSARDANTPPSFSSEAFLYRLNLTNATLELFSEEIGTVLSSDFGFDALPFRAFSDITFDREGLLYYTNIIPDIFGEGFEYRLATFSPEAGERIIGLSPVRDVVGNLSVTSTKEVLLGYSFGNIFSVNQQGQSRLVFNGQNILGEGTFSSAFRESTNEFFAAANNNLFVIDRATSRLENLAVLPQTITDLALSEDGRLFALTSSSTVIEVSYK